MLSEVGGGQIREEKEAYALVHSCRPYGGQSVQVSWRGRETMMFALIDDEVMKSHYFFLVITRNSLSQGGFLSN